MATGAAPLRHTLGKLCCRKKREARRGGACVEEAKS